MQSQNKLPYKLHRTRNKAQNTQHKLGLRSIERNNQLSHES